MSRPALRRSTQAELAPYAVAFAGFLVVAVAGGVATKITPWYRRLDTPRWKPPDWAFGPVWTAIFLCATASAGLAWKRSRSRRERRRVVGLFAANGALNIAWSVLFFRLRRPDWALGEVAALWLSVAGLMAALAPIAPLSAWLLAPYLAWVSLASALNAAIVRRNRPFR